MFYPPPASTKQIDTTHNKMNFMSPLLSIAAAIGSTIEWGKPFYRGSQAISLYHHSGCKPNYKKPGKSRPQKTGISQSKARLNRRRAHAAGQKNAFR